MNTHTMQRIIWKTSLLSVMISVGILGTVSAAASNTGTQAHLQAIISAGDKEINRRLTTLGTLANKIHGAAKLTSADKASLTAEVSSEQSGLNALKVKLDSETTVDGAKGDAHSIVNDYRVYALIVPKIELIRVADDQQSVESKLTALAAKLHTRITEAQSKGHDVTSLEASLNDMTTQTQTAQAISSNIESKIINLQPSDYNSDHTILSGDRDQLKSAHAANQAAYNDAKTIIGSLKSI